MSAPAANKRELTFRREEDAIAEIDRLRSGGYTQLGNWTLAQICWHLEKSIEGRMKPGPFPPDSDEQLQRKAALPGILSSGRLPNGIKAPDAMEPPAESSEDSIGACIATLKRFREYTGEITPHRLFGHLSDAEVRQLNLVHCAHHLSCLVPKA